MDDKRPEVERDKAKRLREEGDVFVLVTWQPQWGGYTAPCEVRFHRESGSGEGELGCFEARYWHDGEFPTSDPTETTAYHYCGADQIVDFGIEVLEAQLGRQVNHRGKPARLDPVWIEQAIERLQRLAATQRHGEEPR